MSSAYAFCPIGAQRRFWAAFLSKSGKWVIFPDKSPSKRAARKPSALGGMPRVRKINKPPHRKVARLCASLHILKESKKIFKKVLTSGKQSAIIHWSAQKRRQYGSIAQLGEHLPYKQRVTGSSPVVSTNGPVVQLVRTLACHARGRGFESHPGRHTVLYCMPL